MMNATQVFEQSIRIEASVPIVDQTITDRDLMHQWLNPMLRCDPVGDWQSEVGAECLFTIQIPLIRPTLRSVVAERRIGLVVWEFDGFFRGRDRWECFAEAGGTRLVNRFEFQIPNQWVAFGFRTFAARWTQQDMQAQLVRLKRVAESLG